MSQTYKSESNRMLGYPDDARLLIVNADDFGMYLAINQAVLRALKQGVVQSTSLMVPCPGASQAVQILAENPDISFAIHLSVICDIPTYRWSPLTAREKIPSLVDETGNFYTLDRMSEFLAQAKLDELEVEFRAQIDAVFAANLKPTHLDWHCLYAGGRADIFEMSLRLAKEYGLALRVAHQPYMDQVLNRGLPTVEHDLLDSFNLDLADKPDQYARMLRELPVGLSEWAVHPGIADAEAQTIDPEGWQVRSTDYEFVISPQAHEIIQQEGIILLDYKPLQKAWQSKNQ